MPDRRGWRPPEPALHTAESETHIRVWLSVPNIEPGSMTVAVNGATVTISARQCAIAEAARAPRPDRRLARSHRWSLRLPFAATADQVEANCQGGIIELTIAKPMPIESHVPVRHRAA